MRYFIFLILMFVGTICQAQTWEDRRLFKSGAGTQKLRILSSTDAIYLAPTITEFVAQNDDIAVEYLVAGTAQIYDLMRETPEQFDVVISSAMDLQIKLVNDGFAAQIEGIETPNWTKWRESLFGFTAEPAAIVVNKKAFQTFQRIETRQDLIEVLRTHPEVFRDKIATYDIRRSGLGYLFAAQDARTSETFWRLTEVMGGLGARLYCCSGEMIEGVARGDILVAYNVLGSYASAQSQLQDEIEVIVPSDFAITMMRTVFVSNTAPNPASAQNFTRFMLSYFAEEGRPDGFLLPALLPQKEAGEQSSIPLEPSLMIYLDKLKRAAFTQEWQSAIVQ